MSHVPDQNPTEVAQLETAGSDHPTKGDEAFDVPRIVPLPSWTGTALVLWPAVTLLTAAAVGAMGDAGHALAAATLMNFAMIFVATLWASTDVSPRSVMAAAVGAAVVVALLAAVLAGSAWIGRKATTVEVSAAVLFIATPASDDASAHGLRPLL